MPLQLQVSSIIYEIVPRQGMTPDSRKLKTLAAIPSPKSGRNASVSWYTKLFE